METLSKTLADNLAYYIEDPSRRCVNDGNNDENGCFYSPKKVNHTTEGCFVGRLLPEQLKVEFDDVPCDTQIEEILYEFREGLIEFSSKIPSIVLDNSEIMGRFQNLHDSKNFWDNEGLIKIGKEVLTEIINDFELIHQKDFEQFLK